jgi:hypothetical protein
MDGWMDGWMDGRTDGWMDGWKDGRMDGWMDGWMVLHLAQGITLLNYKPLHYLTIKYILCI